MLMPFGNLNQILFHISIVQVKMSQSDTVADDNMRIGYIGNRFVLFRKIYIVFFYIFKVKF